MSVLDRLIGGPRLYDAVQVLCGLRRTQARLRPVVSDTEGQTVLDLGGGTELVRALFVGRAGACVRRTPPRRPPRPRPC